MISLWVKKLFAVLVLLAGTVLSGSEKINWQEWRLITGNNVNAEYAAMLRDCGNLKAAAVTIPAGGIDLNKVLNQPAQGGKTAILFKKVFSEKNQVVKLGLGVDWWFELYCNNQAVYSTYRSSGNGDNVITSQNQIVALNLRKGENIIAIFLVSGRTSFTVALQQLPPETPAGRMSRMALSEIYNPSKFELKHGPWLLAPAVGEMTVAFMTDGYVGGGVEYRLKGSKNWQKAWHTIGGVLQNSTDLHRVKLTGLEPGKVYEYRVLIALSDDKYKALDTHEFTVPATEAAEFEFFVTSDTQFGPVTRGRYLANWQPLMKNSAFQASVGDLTGSYDDIEAMLFGGYLDWQSPEMYHNKPFVAVRGNHELRGRQRGRWFDLLGPERDRAYFAFRYGNACIVVLDSWGNSTDIKRNTLSSDAMKEYMHRQRQWVEKLVNSPEYANAGYRIILAHFSPHACNPYDTKMLKYVAEPLFKASLDKSKLIHLYIAAHIHKYRRTVPGTTSVFANAKVVVGEVVDGKNYNFPILILDGPGKNFGFDLSASVIKVTPEFLEVKSFDDKNNCFDHFTVDKQGKVSEIDNPYKKSILKLYEF